MAADKWSDVVFPDVPTGEVIVKSHEKNCPLRGFTEKRHPQQFKKFRGKCDCPKHFQINVTGVEIPRIAAGVNSWSEAEDRLKFWLEQHHPLAVKARLDKVAAFVLEIEIDYAFNEMISKKKADATKGKIATVRDQLIAFIKDYNERNPKQRVRWVKDITVPVLDEFQATWTGVSLDGNGKRTVAIGTAKGKRGVLSRFFVFCMKRNWYADSKMLIEVRGRVYTDTPARHIEISGVKTANTHYPLSDRLEAAIFDACSRYDELCFSVNREQLAGVAEGMRLLSELMSATGFGITDAYTAETSRLDENNVFELRRIKVEGNADIPVVVKIRPELADRLRALAQGRAYFFWNGQGKRAKAVNNVRIYERYARIWASIPDALKADLPDRKFGPHCFRNTLARRLFRKGASVPEVARILGNSDAIVRKHYWKLIPAEQERLSSLVEATWAIEPLTVQ
jgi:integrase